MNTNHRSQLRARMQEGFTLIELMIVIAIIGILAAIGIPAYQDYVARTRISEGPSLAAPAMTALGIACSEGTLNAALNNTAIGIPLPVAITGKHVATVTATSAGAANGTVTIAYNGTISGVPNGSTLIYLGSCAPGSGMRWDIDTVNSTVPPQLLPRT